MWNLRKPLREANDWKLKPCEHFSSFFYDYGNGFPVSSTNSSKYNFRRVSYLIIVLQWKIQNVYINNIAQPLSLSYSGELSINLMIHAWYYSMLIWCWMQFCYFYGVLDSCFIPHDSFFLNVQLITYYILHTYDMLCCVRCRLDSFYDQFLNSVLPNAIHFRHFFLVCWFFLLGLWCFALLCFVFHSSGYWDWDWERREKAERVRAQTHMRMHARDNSEGMYTLYAAMHERTKINQYRIVCVEHWTFNI